MAIITDSSFFILKYHPEIVANYVSHPQDIPEGGIDDAFDLVIEIQDSVKTGCWIGDCFIFTNAVNRLNYFIGGQSYPIMHYDKPMYLLGYLARDDRIYLVDKDMTFISQYLPLSVIEYQTAVLRDDMEAADRLLLGVPVDQRGRISRFLEVQGMS